MRVAKALEQIISGMTLTYNEYKSDNTIKGEVTKAVQFSFGDQKELNKWIAGRGSLSKYPLVWYVLKEYDKEVDENRYITVDNARIILFTSTKQEYYNQTRALINYSEILDPLSKLLEKQMQLSGKFEFVDESLKIIDIPCYGLDGQDFGASNTKSVTLDYLDARTLTANLRVYTTCNS